MSDEVQFDEDKIGFNTGRNPRPGSFGGAPAQSVEPKMVQWLMRKGWAKSAKSANMILLAIVVVDVVIAYLVIHFFL